MELLIGKHASVCVPTALVEGVRLAEYTCINTGKTKYRKANKSQMYNGCIREKGIRQAGKQIIM